ncbi:MAG: hypothetical protein KDC27_15705 [Acidobacteria bacterium]|nr:hypothetical protein [Acidobacteriota bacterium]
MWLVIVLVAAVAAFALAVWGASALWVHIISKRWDAMCAEEEPPRRT